MNAVPHNYQKTSIRMNDDPQLFEKTNDIPRKDAVYCLENCLPKFQWKKDNIKIIDIGSADGSVTNILCNYLPINFELVVGCDINEEVVKYANNKYRNKKRIFTVLDIEGDLPTDLMNSFDYVFSFYTMHWLENQKKGFLNIYNLLADNGECLITVAGFTPLYSIFRALSEFDKWKSWLMNIDKFVSPYHDCQDPDKKISGILKEIGFNKIDVSCTQKVHIFDSENALQLTMKSINPFKIPNEMMDEFLNDIAKVARDMKLVNKDNNTVKLIYNLIMIYCKKNSELNSIENNLGT